MNHDEHGQTIISEAIKGVELYEHLVKTCEANKIDCKYWVEDFRAKRDIYKKILELLSYDSSTSSSIDSEEPNAESVGLSEDLAVFCFDCEHYAYDRRWCTLTKITMNRNNSCPEYDSLHRTKMEED